MKLTHILIGKPHIPKQESGPLMKLTHIMSKFFLTHIVSVAAKTFGKSHSSLFLIFQNVSRLTI
ncbi:hypothetical protein Krac_0893 [Ktedonobacter racemifer DSM 44963]|uniref:Uncharacterized protein n=1 Tax=Ktedonobacter racemifer DSM 44963 TaxID=485913 RepID=D6U5P3_KTERA|nr:hypothetical protein Krac_0893 [Ktedonobacter racemifer DSM 44963]